MTKRPSRAELEDALRQLEMQQKQLEDHKAKLAEGLPHLYMNGGKWYKWNRAFFESTNRMNLLFAGNQLGKSTIQWRKAIHLATEPSVWPKYFGNHRPRLFLYFYPNWQTATTEVKHKIVPEFLPRGEFEKHPQYGWKINYQDKKMVHSIDFNTGVTIEFRVYQQDVHNLQAISPAAVFADEEMPVEIYDEVAARLFATGGPFSMVCTPTRGQDLWRRAAEGKGSAETFPQAFKLQVSMYDCLKYDDGAPGHFTLERIKEIEQTCKSEREREKRVMGRFIVEDGVKYPEWNPSRHFIAPHDVPQTWHRYVGIDIGSGGSRGHPPTICFTAVQPDYRYAVVYKGWIGDDGQIYTAGDIYNKFVEISKGEVFVAKFYDYHSKDFFTISDRAGDTFLKADKSHDRGEQVINTLFSNDMLMVFDTPELRKLGTELSNLLKDTDKRQAVDDFADALRYAISAVPFDWTAIKEDQPKPEVVNPHFKDVRMLTEQDLRRIEMDERRGIVPREDDNEWQEFFDEFDYWNDNADA